MNREDWLGALAAKLAPLMEEAGFPVDLGRVRVSVGFPGGGSPRKRIGECWSSVVSAAGFTEIFVSPVLGTAEEVDHVLLHELIHAAVGTDAGHKGPFRRAAKAVGLVGKMTATTAGPELRERLNALTAEVGTHPHSRMALSTRNKQSARMLKLECWDCGYVVRTTKRWIAVGLPTCSCGGEFEFTD